jgi:hypothetical protein
MLFDYEQTSKPHLYELIYVVLYFILGNIPGIGVKGDNHLQSFLFGLIAFYALKHSRKLKILICLFQINKTLIILFSILCGCERELPGW